MTDDQSPMLSENSWVRLSLAAAICGGVATLAWQVSAANAALKALADGQSAMNAKLANIEGKVDGQAERVGENAGRLRVLEDWRKAIDEKLRGVK